jgi:2-octaprenyl-6-methoxyphenol hydroxylase
VALTQSTKYDVVIVGGGMVGASLACTLQQSSPQLLLNILLVESLPVRIQEKPLQPSFDSRSTVLSFGTAEYFRQMGLWEALDKFAEPIKNIHVSDQGKFGAVRMDSAEQGVDALGYVLENQALGTVLNQAILNADRVEVCSPAKVSEIQIDADHAELLLEQDGHTASVKADLVVLAEGARSGLCEQLGIHRSNEHYGQEAIIANVAFTQSHQNIAYERFTPKGPMALLPLTTVDEENRAALVWTQPAEIVETVRLLDDDEFLAQLQNDFGSRLGEFTRVGERKSYPLSLQQAEEQTRAGLVLLGNAAHALHPVAGQGFNLALRDTMRLAENIIESLQIGVNPGSASRLQTYTKVSESDQDKTIAFSHYMTGMFSNNNTALVWARKFGLLSIDLIPPVKKSLSRQAMGMSERMVNVHSAELQ